MGNIRAKRMFLKGLFLFRIQSFVVKISPAKNSQGFMSKITETCK